MDTEKRFEKLDEFVVETRERLVRIETRLDHIEAHMVTKADLAEFSGTMVKWMVGTASGMAIAGITVMTFVLNNAVPKAAPQPAPAPIIIQLPPYK
jgi:hypothetical protein